jgi:hypothetical protein
VSAAQSGCRKTAARAERTLVLKRLVLVLLGLVTVAAAASVLAFLNWRPDAESACGQRCSPERLEEIEQLLGQNEPIHVQYWDYLRLAWDCRDLEPPAVRVDPNRSRCDQPEL